MKLRSLAAASVLLSAGLVAHADTITQTFAVPLVFTNPFGTSSAYSANIVGAPFDPSLGTLNSVILGLTGAVTLNQQFSSITFEGYLESQRSRTTMQTPTAGVPYNAVFAIFATDPADLLAAEGPAGVSAGVDFMGPISKSTVGASLIYNYTPATTPVAATPEPSSLALLGTGLLGAVGVVRKRFA